MNGTNSHINQISNSDWEKLRLAFQQESLVLVLGPNLSTIADSERDAPLTQHLARHIFERIDPDQRITATTDLTTLAGMLVEQKGRSTLDVAIDSFFQNAPEPSETQQRLARLPFRIVINAARDKQICRALDRANAKYREEFYHFRQHRQFDYDARDPRTFVYHLFGCTDCFDPAKGQSVKTLGSLVMTGSDQVEFVKQVVQTERKIPNSLLMELNDTKTYLFLGFNFEDWYLRLLLYGLNLSDRTDAMPSWALHNGPSELPFSAAVFFKSRYKLNFLPLSEIDFVHDLLVRYETEFSAGYNRSTNGAQRVLKALIISDPADQAERRAFEQSLAPLRHRFQLHIHETRPGEDVEATFAAQLADSQFVFPLITANFLGNDELIERFYEKILPADQPGQCLVSPIICGACQWKPLLRGPILNNVLPNNLTPISQWPDPAAAWTDIATEIERRIKTHFSL